jgi:hypothetical protein
MSSYHRSARRSPHAVEASQSPRSVEAMLKSSFCRGNVEVLVPSRQSQSPRAIEAISKSSRRRGNIEALVLSRQSRSPHVGEAILKPSYLRGRCAAHSVLVHHVYLRATNSVWGTVFVRVWLILSQHTVIPSCVRFCLGTLHFSAIVLFRCTRSCLCAAVQFRHHFCWTSLFQRACRNGALKGNGLYHPLMVVFGGKSNGMLILGLPFSEVCCNKSFRDEWPNHFIMNIVQR